MRRARIDAVWVVAAWALVAGGCSTLDYRGHDAPGTVDLAEQPEASSVVAGWQTEPSDPGEEGVSVTLFGTFTAVEWWLSNSNRRVTRSLGVGTSLEYLWRSTSHTYGAEDSLAEVRPYWSTGLHIGIDALDVGPGIGQAEAIRPGAVKIEGLIGHRAPGALRVGYEFVPSTGSSGPRATLELFGMAWVGSTYRLDRGWSLEIGVSPRWIWGWVWSR
jgi:hypothetical protein